MEIRIGYPNPQQEEQIVGMTTGEAIAPPAAITSRDAFLALQTFVRKVPAPPSVVQYAVALATATRPDGAAPSEVAKNYLEWGAGPRAGQALVLGAKARAVLNGRPAPQPSDVEALALPVLRHRVIPNYRAVGEGLNSQTLIQRLLKQVPKPHDR
jgi:MoxR-like ATPase